MGKRAQRRFGRSEYSKEALLKEIRKMARRLGRCPRWREIDENRALPGWETVRKKVGPLHKIAREIGYPMAKFTRYDPDEVLRRLKKWAKRLGRTPGRREVDANPSVPCSDKIRRLFGGAQELSRRLGYPLKSRRLYTDEELLLRLKQKAERLGRIPTTIEVNRDRDTPSLSVYKKRFGSYPRAVELIGYTPRRRDLYTIQSYKDAIMKFYKIHKRPPRACELKGVGGPSPGYYRHKLTLNQLLTECGLPIHSNFRPYAVNRRAELIVKARLRRAGHKVVDLTERNPFEPYSFLVDGKIRVHVSGSEEHPSRGKQGRMIWRFIVPRKLKFDYMIGVGMDGAGKLKDLFVFPKRIAIQVKGITVPVYGKGKYSRYYTPGLTGYFS